MTNYGAKLFLEKANPLELQIDSYMSLISVTQEDGLVLAPVVPPFKQLFSSTDIQSTCVNCYDIFGGSRSDMFNDTSEEKMRELHKLKVLLLIILLFMRAPFRMSYLYLLYKHS